MVDQNRRHMIGYAATGLTGVGVSKALGTNTNKPEDPCGETTIKTTTVVASPFKVTLHGEVTHFGSYHQVFGTMQLREADAPEWDWVGTDVGIYNPQMKPDWEDRDDVLLQGNNVLGPSFSSTMTTPGHLTIQPNTTYAYRASVELPTVAGDRPVVTGEWKEFTTPEFETSTDDDQVTGESASVEPETDTPRGTHSPTETGQTPTDTATETERPSTPTPTAQPDTDTPTDTPTETPTSSPSPTPVEDTPFNVATTTETESERGFTWLEWVRNLFGLNTTDG